MSETPSTYRLAPLLHHFIGHSKDSKSKHWVRSKLKGIRGYIRNYFPGFKDWHTENIKPTSIEL